MLQRRNPGALMFFISLLSLFICSCNSPTPVVSEKWQQVELPVDESITVVAHRNIELYVAPANITNETDFISSTINEYSVFAYASSHYKTAKVSNGAGGHEPYTMGGRQLYVYNNDTIEYAWDNCNYIKDPKHCSATNDHYLLETHITINNDQLVIALYLFDPEMQIISQGTVTNTKLIKWIRQQATTTTTNQMGTLPQNQTTSRSCSTTKCSPSRSLTQNPGSYQRETVVDKPLEELPLRWEIPHRLLDQQIRQASLRLWVGAILY